MAGTSKFGLLRSHLASLADQLKKAPITYTESGGQGNPTFDTAQAIAVMLEKHGIACVGMCKRVEAAANSPAYGKPGGTARL